jgi:signal transduction histidine kinase
MNFTDTLLILSSILNLALIALNLPKVFKSITNISFVGINFGILTWVFGNFQIDRSSGVDNAISWARISGIGVILFFLSLNYFSLYFYQSLLGLNRKFFLLLSITGSIFLILLIASDLIVKGADITQFPVKISYGRGYLGLIIWILLSLISTYINIGTKYKTIQDKNKSTQFKLLSICFSIIIIISIITNLILPNTGDSSLTRFGPVTTLLLVAMTSFLILKYQFLDIRILLGRITYFGIAGLIVAIGYYFALTFDLLVFKDPFSISALAASIPMSIGFVVLYDAFRKFVQNKLNSTLINPDFDPSEVLTTFNNDISTILDYEGIAQHTLDTMGKTIRPKYKGILIKFGNRMELLDDGVALNDFQLDYNRILNIWNSTNHYRISLDELEIEIPKILRPFTTDLQIIMEKMRKDQIKLLIPVQSPNGVIGILLLGQKEADSPYNSIQIGFIETIANLVGLALTRALLYIEVRDFNRTLQKKVEVATQEIQSQNAKLSEALNNERDMLDILGHELRTPLGIIRNAIGLFDINFKTNKLSDDEITKFIKIAQNNIRREIQLLETILASAKIDNAKLDLDFEKIEANDVVHDSFEAYKYDAEKRSLKLTVNILPDQNFVYADRLRIQQVMDNLTSNAIKYTEKGNVEIGMLDEGKYIRYYVKDTGMGISDEDVKNLGKKFFRANNYIKSETNLKGRKVIRPGGNGIGLYVVFQLVKYMHGEVNVQSKLAEGSTFSFTVLKYSEELENEMQMLEEAKNGSVKAIESEEHKINPAEVKSVN